MPLTPKEMIRLLEKNGASYFEACRVKALKPER